MGNDNWAQLVLESISKLASSPANSWGQAVNYSGLPDCTTVPGSTWLVLVGTGIWPVNKPSGWYYSTGTDWTYLGAYNPIVTGGNVVVTNFPSAPSTGEGTTIEVSSSGVRILAADNTRKGFVLTAETGVIYIGIGFMPTSSQYTYRMTNNSVVEKDGYVGPVYATADQGSKEIYITEIK